MKNKEIMVIWPKETYIEDFDNQKTEFVRILDKENTKVLYPPNHAVINFVVETPQIEDLWVLVPKEGFWYIKDKTVLKYLISRAKELGKEITYVCITEGAIEVVPEQFKTI